MLLPAFVKSSHAVFISLSCSFVNSVSLIKQVRSCLVISLGFFNLRRSVIECFLGEDLRSFGFSYELFVHLNHCFFFGRIESIVGGFQVADNSAIHFFGNFVRHLFLRQISLTIEKLACEVKQCNFGISERRFCLCQYVKSIKKSLPFLVAIFARTWLSAGSVTRTCALTWRRRSGSLSRRLRPAFGSTGNSRTAFGAARSSGTARLSTGLTGSATFMGCDKRRASEQFMTETHEVDTVEVIKLCCEIIQLSRCQVILCSGNVVLNVRDSIHRINQIEHRVE